MCNFTLAVNRRKTAQQDHPEADFFSVAAWNELGENCSKYLAKGRKAAVVGSVSVRTYQAKDGTTKAQMEVLAQEVEFLTPRGEEPAQTASSPAPMPVTDEELPF